MKVAVLQQNLVVGDVAGNARRIQAGYGAALEAGAELVVSSELSLLGYPPLDLLQRQDVIDQQLAALDELAATSSVPLVVGFAERNPEPTGKPLFNAAAVLAGGRLAAVRRKALLPTYDVFDERRYFEPYTKPQGAVSVNGYRLGLLICEDIWSGLELPAHRKLYRDDPVAGLAGRRLDAVLVINGSPYWWGKGGVRLDLAADVARRLEAPVVYSNQVGGNDELVFDGRSFAVDAHGAPIGAAKPFAEQTLLVDLEYAAHVSWASDGGNLADVEAAFVLGLRDYLDKVAAFPGGAVLALSGGIDSALVACLGAEALGADSMLAVTMPSRFSSPAGVEDARTLAANLGLELRTIPIDGLYRAFQSALEPELGWVDPPQVTEENIQSRIRGAIVMAIANRERRIVLGTGNKSELAMGYCTLYGDMAAGLGVISDLPKTLVHQLAGFVNRRRPVIPERVLAKPPSAELRPGQRDTDSLPPYEQLDPILHAYIEEEQSPEKLASAGFDPVLVAQVVGTVERMEFKRRQMAPGLKVTSKAFGSGRRLPIAAQVRLQPTSVGVPPNRAS